MPHVEAATIARFQTETGTLVSAPVQPGQSYRARWSLDLLQWDDLGDTFLPSDNTSRELPNGEQGFIQLIPEFRIDEKDLLIVIIGDSTISDLSPISPQHHGWGQVLGDFFKPGVRVANLAEGGISTRRFLAEERIKQVARLNPDVVIMQFGHIDFNEQLPFGVYEENLETIVTEVRSLGAIPLLVTSVSRRRFDAEGNLIIDLEKHRQSMKKVAQASNVSVSDLNGHSVALYQRLGPEQSPVLTVCGDACNDTSHFSRVGAYVMASLAVQEFPPLLKAYTVPLDSLADKIAAAFKNNKRFEGLQTPFPEISGGFEEEELWDWVYPEGKPVLTND